MFFMQLKIRAKSQSDYYFGTERVTNEIEVSVPDKKINNPTDNI